MLEQLEVVLEQLAQSDYALWVQQSWGWAGALTLHAYGTATILGFITIMALRLFGLFPKIPFTALRSLVPFCFSKSCSNERLLAGMRRELRRQWESKLPPRAACYGLALSSAGD